MRREYNTDPPPLLICTGSPLHAQGIPGWSVDIFSNDRITPACAGNTFHYLTEDNKDRITQIGRAHV